MTDVPLFCPGGLSKCFLDLFVNSSLDIKIDEELSRFGNLSSEWILDLLVNDSLVIDGQFSLGEECLVDLFVDDNKVE